MLTALPLLVCSVCEVTPALWCLLSLVNGLFACGDVIIFTAVFWQIPTGAVVREHGWDVWWRATDGAPNDSRDRGSGVKVEGDGLGCGPS